MNSMFYERFSPIVASSTSLLNAAMDLNYNIWQPWGIHFVSGQTPMIMSPSQVSHRDHPRASAGTGLALRARGASAHATRVPCLHGRGMT